MPGFEQDLWPQPRMCAVVHEGLGHYFGSPGAVDPLGGKIPIRICLALPRGYK
jgi:hypothetical protein